MPASPHAECDFTYISIKDLKDSNASQLLQFQKEFFSNIKVKKQQFCFSTLLSSTTVENSEEF
jgi:hypothetical protein